MEDMAMLLEEYGILYVSADTKHWNCVEICALALCCHMTHSSHDDQLPRDDGAVVLEEAVSLTDMLDVGRMVQVMELLSRSC
jgi:hypothetical protein